MRIPRLLQKFLCSLLMLSIVAGSSWFGTKEAFAKERKTITYEGDNFKVDFQVISQWTGAFNANVKITNTGDRVIDNWANRSRTA